MVRGFSRVWHSNELNCSKWNVKKPLKRYAFCWREWKNHQHSKAASTKAAAWVWSTACKTKFSPNSFHYRHSLQFTIALANKIKAKNSKNIHRCANRQCFALIFLAQEIAEHYTAKQSIPSARMSHRYWKLKSSASPTHWLTFSFKFKSIGIKFLIQVNRLGHIMIIFEG